MAVQKLKNYDSNHTFNDTINFWSNRPWKNPSVGKTSEREGVLLISSNLEITSAEFKPTVYLSLPRNSCMNLTGKITTTVPSFSVPRLPYSTACPELMLCDLLWKSCPKNGSSRTAAVQLYGWVNVPSLPRFPCCCVCWNWTVCSAVPNPYRTDFFFCWLPRFSCCFFVLEIVPLFLLQTLLQKWETLLLFLLSLNLSNSHGKNEFVFGLFPPLESLSDS